MTDALDAMVATDLQADEGRRFFVYDDANGKPIVPGYTVIGHPTIGAGRALDVKGISPAELLVLLDDDEQEFRTKLEAALPWIKQLDITREAILIEMSFNLGVTGLLGFHNTLAAVQAGRWADAATAMLASHWAFQVGDRAKRLANAMITGVHPDGPL